MARKKRKKRTTSISMNAWFKEQSEKGNNPFNLITHINRKTAR